MNQCIYVTFFSSTVTNLLETQASAYIKTSDLQSICTLGKVIVIGTDNGVYDFFLCGCTSLDSSAWTSIVEHHHMGRGCGEVDVDQRVIIGKHGGALKIPPIHLLNLAPNSISKS